MLLNEHKKNISLNYKLNYKLMKNKLFCKYQNNIYRVINISISSSRTIIYLLPNEYTFDNKKSYLDSKISKYVIRVNDADKIERFFDSNNNLLSWNELLNTFFNNEYYYREF